jgi:hypothetical protein
VLGLSSIRSRSTRIIAGVLFVSFCFQQFLDVTTLRYVNGDGARRFLLIASKHLQGDYFTWTNEGFLARGFIVSLRYFLMNFSLMFSKDIDKAFVVFCSLLALLNVLICVLTFLIVKKLLGIKNAIFIFTPLILLCNLASVFPDAEILLASFIVIAWVAIVLFNENEKLTFSSSTILLIMIFFGSELHEIVIPILTFVTILRIIAIMFLKQKRNLMDIYILLTLPTQLIGWYVQVANFGRAPTSDSIFTSVLFKPLEWTAKPLVPIILIFSAIVILQSLFKFYKGPFNVITMKSGILLVIVFTAILISGEFPNHKNMWFYIPVRVEIMWMTLLICTALTTRTLLGKLKDNNPEKIDTIVAIILISLVVTVSLVRFSETKAWHSCKQQQFERLSNLNGFIPVEVLPTQSCDIGWPDLPTALLMMDPRTVSSLPIGSDPGTWGVPRIENGILFWADLEIPLKNFSSPLPINGTKY